MNKPKILIVNEHDEVIGAEDKKIALEKELIRRVSRVFLQDEAGRVFLQRRGPHVEIRPNFWGTSASGHVDEGEDYHASAQRELKEELGLEHIPLQKLKHYYWEEVENDRTLKAWATLYLARYDGQAIHLQEEEVAGGKWFTAKEIDQLIIDNPTLCSDMFIYTWNEFKELTGSTLSK